MNAKQKATWEAYANAEDICRAAQEAKKAASKFYRIAIAVHKDAYSRYLDAANRHNKNINFKLNMER